MDRKHDCVNGRGSRSQSSNTQVSAIRQANPTTLREKLSIVPIGSVSILTGGFFASGEAEGYAYYPKGKEGGADPEEPILN